MNGEFKVDDRVIPNQHALRHLLEGKTGAERQRVLTTKYFVTGVGPTCIGIRPEGGTKSFNIRKCDAVNVS